jgi:electron transfer flavoprotein beta subunit
VASTPAAATGRVRILGAHPYRPRPRELPAPTGTALRRTLELTGALVQRTPPAVVGPLSPEEAASELLAYLRRWGYVSADYELAADPARTEPKKPAATHETGI